MASRARVFVIGAALTLVGCSAGVQRAKLGPPSATPSPPAPLPASLTHGLAKRYVVRAQRSRLAVFGSDVISGSHRLTFGRWQAHVTTEPGLAIHVELDTSTVHAEAPFLTSIARNELLEADRYPRATLSGTLRVVDEHAGKVVVEGIADLHGVRQGIRIEGTLKRQGDDFRFRADFVVSRTAFAIRARPAWDSFIKDDVRVVVDALVTPERVTVESPPEAEPEVNPESEPKPETETEPEDQRSKQ